MDYLQYLHLHMICLNLILLVLNLVINGLPSIPMKVISVNLISDKGVLNLVINGLPSIPH